MRAERRTAGHSHGPTGEGALGAEGVLGALGRPLAGAGRGPEPEGTGGRDGGDPGPLGAAVEKRRPVQDAASSSA